MRRILFMILVVFLIVIGASYIEEGVKTEAKDDFQTFIKSGELQNIATSILVSFQSLFERIKDQVDPSPEGTPQEDVEKPVLSVPSEQTFSIHNVQIGAQKEEVEAILGEPQRSSNNEYGHNWFTYHQNYQNFVQVMYNHNEQVVGLFTNQDLISSAKNIHLDTTREYVLEQLGAPLTRIQKGFVYYQLQDDANYDVFHLDESFVTVFYDIHEGNTLTSLQIIHEDLEGDKKSFYASASEPLKEGFEWQMFDLTNATRVQHGLGVLTWDERVRKTARKHSADMAENAYFDHTNLKGQSPFDRMLADQITFSVAGENLAYGQFSSIFAHEGLMNSEGHRKNILKAEFDHLGVGVAFNDESHPYYTQNYFSQ